MRRARSFSWSSAEMPMTSPSSIVSSPFGGAKPGGGACGPPSELQVRRGAFGGGMVLAMSFADSVIFVGLLGGVVREGLAFFFSASSAAFAASSMDEAAFELARLRAIAGCFS
jgi:hypothetical protein